MTLINDVLDLAKVEAGKIELYHVDFNFNEFIQNLTELFQIRAQQKGIVFIYEPLSHLPLGVHTDEIVMPIMDGFEMVRQLRQQLQFRPLPIIAASASVFEYH